MITHKLIIIHDSIVPKYKYLCNQACSITQEKAKGLWKDVTCKNCLMHKFRKAERLM